MKGGVSQCADGPARIRQKLENVGIFDEQKLLDLSSDFRG